MNAFTGLLKKDLFLMRFPFAVWIIVTFLCVAGGYTVANYMSEPDLIVPGIVLLAGIQIAVMPFLLLLVLRLEGKTQLWLYNPQSSYKLLFSKISAAALLQLISQIIITVYGLIGTRILMGSGIIASASDFLPLKQAVYFNLGIFSVAFYMSIWVIFLWSIYHSLGKYPAIKNFRWLIVVLTWVAYNIFETLLVKLSIVQNNLFRFGVEVNVTPKMNYQLENGWQIQYTDLIVPVAPFVFYTILAVALFLIASRLLDRKVEV